jgi:hypothetical protein
MAEQPRGVFGLRVLARLGGGNVIRVGLVVLWIGLLAQIVTILRPDLLHPAEFGTDTSNYAAAGERMIGGEVYTLSPGDRPVPADNPPQWHVPILSPPTVATLWAAMLVVPDPMRFHLLWAAGLGATTALVVFLIVRAPLVLLAALYLCMGNLGVMALSGNANALIAPGLAAVWSLSAPDRGRRAHSIAGVLVGIAALIKLGPAFLALWLIAQRRWDAVVGATVTAVVWLGATVILGGTSIFREFFEVIRTSAALASPLSIPGIAGSIGISADLQLPALVAALITAVIVIVVLRRRPGFTFAVAVLAAVFSTTVVRPDTFVVIAAAAVPLINWTARPSLIQDWRTSGKAIPVVAILVSLAGLAAAVSTGGFARSSLTIQNELNMPVIVRFAQPAGGGSYGYRIDPGIGGIAWSDRMGRPAASIMVFSNDCRLLHRFEPNATTRMLRIFDGGVDLHGATGSSFLPYVNSCAAELLASL